MDGPPPPNQYRTLVAMLLRIQIRGRRGKSRYGRLLSIGISYAVAATYLGYSLSRAYFEPAFLIVTYSVMLYIAGFTFIGSYPLILLDKSDRSILEQFPISDTTLSLARITNLGLYILYVSVPFVVPLAAFYGYQSEHALYAVLYGLTMMGASVWATLFFLVLTLQLLQRSERFHSVLSALQMLLVFGLLIFYQAMPRYFIHNIEWNALFSGVWSYVLPPFWIAAQFRLLTADIAGVQTWIGGGLFFLSAALMAWMISRSWSLPLDALSSSRKTRTNPIISIYDRFARLWPGNAQSRAGYDFFVQTAFRERSVRLQILPMALMPVATAIYGILSGELSSPFPQILTGWYSKMHIPVLVFYLFVARHIEHVAMFSPVMNAQWMFHLYSRPGLHSFRKGVRRGGNLRILLPLALVLFLLFTFTMPLIEAALQATFLYMAAMVQTSIFMVIGRNVPFTQDVNQIEAFKRVSQLFIVVPFMIVFWLLHYVSSASYISFGIMLLGLACMVILLSKVSQRRRLELIAW